MGGGLEDFELTWRIMGTGMVYLMVGESEDEKMEKRQGERVVG